MRKSTVVAGLVIVAAVTAAGCRQGGSARGGSGGGAGATRAEQSDRTAQAEGRLSVDQSAVLPVDVKAGVLREYPAATVQNVEKKTYDDRVVRYEVQLTTRDGKRVTREFDENGKPAGR